MSIEYLETDKEKIEYLKNLFIAAGRNKHSVDDEVDYSELKEELFKNTALKSYLPSLIRTCSKLSQFYDLMKSKKLQYTQRDEFVNEEFKSIETYLNIGLTATNLTSAYKLDNLQKDLNIHINTTKKITNIYGEFELVSKTLGQGGTSMVKGFKFEGVEYAIKFLNENIKNSDTKAFKRFKQAHLNLATINSSSVIPQLHMDKLEVNQELTVPYIIMAKADKTLKEYVVELKKDGKFTATCFYNIYSNLFDIIEDIHNHKIIHRDIKPENIFLYNEKFVLGDFDIASFDEELHIKLHDTKDGERLANAYCSAPEQFKKGFKATYATDLFALGQIIHWMLTGNYLKGQSSINYSKEYKTIEPIVKNLLQEKQENRFQSIQKIKEFLKMSKKPTFEDEIHQFDSFIEKYTFDIEERYKLKRFDTDIEEIINDLNTVGDITQLEYQSFYANMTFNKIQTIDKENSVYRLNSINLEFKVKSITFFKHVHNFADTLIIIETDNLNKAIEDKYDNDEDQIYYEYEGGLFNTEQLSNGWVLLNNKRVQTNGKQEEIKRILNKRLIFISSRNSSILHTNDILINSMCEEYERDTINFFNDEFRVMILETLKKFKRSDKVKLLN